MLFAGKDDVWERFFGFVVSDKIVDFVEFSVFDLPRFWLANDLRTKLSICSYADFNSEAPRLYPGIRNYGSVSPSHSMMHSSIRYPSIHGNTSMATIYQTNPSAAHAVQRPETNISIQILIILNGWGNVLITKI